MISGSGSGSGGSIYYMYEWRVGSPVRMRFSYTSCSYIFIALSCLSKGHDDGLVWD